MAPSWVLLRPELPFTHDSALFSEASQESKGWMREGRPPHPEETREAITAYLGSLKPDAHVAHPPELSYIRLLRPTDSAPPLCDLVDSGWISSADKSLVALYAGPYRPGGGTYVRKGGYLIYDASTNSLSRIPQIPYKPSQSAIGYATAVVVSFDGDGAGDGAGYVLAELTKIERLKEGSKAELFLWQSSSAGWVSKVALLPAEVCSPTTDFSADKCFSFGGLLCWVDLTKGMVVCELRTMQESNSRLEFRFIPLPDSPIYDLLKPESQTLQVQEFRSIACVGNEIKFVSMDDQVGHLPGHKLELTMWTLSSDLLEWKDKKVYNIGNIWENETHLALGMRKIAPSLPILSKHENHVVYVVFNDLRIVGSHLKCEGQYLVRVDMENNEVKFYRQGKDWIRSQLFTCEIAAQQQVLLQDQQEGDPPKVKVEFEGEPQENNPAKLAAIRLAISTPPASSFSEKRRPGDGDAQTSNSADLRKTKIQPAYDYDVIEKGAGGLSKAGKEVKTLVHCTAGQSEPDDDEVEDTDEDELPSSLLAPKLKDEFESAPQENNPAKTPKGLAFGNAPASRFSEKRRPGDDDAKTSNGAALKKTKIEPPTERLACSARLCDDFEPIPFTKNISQNTTGDEQIYKGGSLDSADHACTSAVSRSSVDPEVVLCSYRGFESDVTQVFVDLCGSRLSFQDENLSEWSVELLIKAACARVGVKSDDFYATLPEKILEPKRPLSCYLIRQNSTISVHPRVRGGVRYLTWDEIVGAEPCFHRVNLPPDLVSNTNQLTSTSASSSSSSSSAAAATTATFLSEHLQHYTRKVLIGMCQKHLGGISFRGRFTSSQILFHEGQVKFDDSIVSEQYSEGSAKQDYHQLFNIFNADFFDESSKSYPLHVEHLLTFLRKTPAGAKPDSEDVVAYLTNHPAVLSYMQRISVCQLLDNLIDRLEMADHNTIYLFLGNLGGLGGWDNLVRKFGAMNKVYVFGGKYDQLGNLLSVLYGTNWQQCLHFSNNFFKHAGQHLNMEELEAAFSLAMHSLNFLGTLLENIAYELENKTSKSKSCSAGIKHFLTCVRVILGKNIASCTV